jgi:hypothetical protein
MGRQVEYIAATIASLKIQRAEKPSQIGRFAMRKTSTNIALVK